MNKLKKLEELLNKKIIDVFCDENETEWIFEESQGNAKLKSLTIQNIPSDALVFSCDVQAKNITNQFLDDSCTMAGVNKGCDIVICFEKGGKIHAIFGEMKSFNFSKSDYQPQLQNSYLLIEYFMKMINLFDNQSVELKPSFYLFHLFEDRKQTRKHRNSGRKGKTHSSPEKPIDMGYELFDRQTEEFSHCYKFGFYAPRTNRSYNPRIDFNSLISDKIERSN